MNELEKLLHSLEKPEPRSAFFRVSKKQLIHRIEFFEKESWFTRLIAKFPITQPSQNYVQTARLRLINRINEAKRPVLSGFNLFKRLAASTLVMTIAVTTTLFFIGGKQPVSASEFTYLQVLNGSATVKHADKLIWDVITGQTELAAGDLIQVSGNGSALVHFFDDSELRLGSDSLLLLSRLDISPGYARQGIIEASLHRGKAWVQTLNVDDGHASFTLVTPDAVLSSVNASFDVETDLVQPTVVRSFRYGVSVRALNRESRALYATGRLNAYQKVTLNPEHSSVYMTALDQTASIQDFSDEDRTETWVAENLAADREHLVTLSGRELLSLKNSAGTLPGDVFYPIKRARERLGLLLSFNQADQEKAQMDIANNRLSEAVVLIQNGETEKARTALAEYQSIVRDIAEKPTSTPEERGELAATVVAVHQKALVATLPVESEISIVKQALDETKQLLAEDPIQKAEIRLNNSLESLVHIQDYVASGDLQAARIALQAHENLASSIIADIGPFADQDQEKAFYSNLLEVQYQERRALAEISRALGDQPETEGILDLVKTADQNLDDGIKLAAATVRPLLPDIALAKAVVLPKDEKVHEFVNKVNIYSTFQGQKNQLSRLFSLYPQYSGDMEFLLKLRDRLDVRTADLINARILDLQRADKEQKSKEVKRKIDRAKQNLEKRVGN